MDDDEKVVQEAAKIMQDSLHRNLADNARSDAETLLLAVITENAYVQAEILSEASLHGREYLASVCMAATLHARHYARWITRNPVYDFGPAMMGADEDCPSREAHVMIRQILATTDAADCMSVAEEVVALLEGADNARCGKFVTHIVALAGDLVATVLRIEGDRVKRDLEGNQEGT